MSDILCPSCGKLNSEGTEICNFCHERIKSDLGDWFNFLEETDQQEESSQKEIIDPNEEETPDWLIGLRETKEPPSVPDGLSSPQKDSPDWLGALADVQPENKAPGMSGLNDAETPNWLKDLDIGKGSQNIEESGQPSETPDWFSGLQSEQTPPYPQNNQIPGEEETEVPAWLSDLHEEQQTPISEEPTQKLVAEEGNIPKWLTELKRDEPASVSQEKESQAEMPLAKESEMPEWLSGLHDEQVPSSTVEIPASLESDETPSQDWYNELQFGEEPISIEKASIPDWLSGLQEEENSPAATENSKAATVPEETQIAERMEEGKREGSLLLDAGIGSPIAEEAQIPDWLRGLQEEETSTPMSGTPEHAATDEIQTPAWLIEVKEEEPLLVFEEIAAEKTDTLPEWLSNLKEQKKTPIEDFPAAEKFSTEDESLPEWLGAPDTEVITKKAEERALINPDEGAVPEWLNVYGNESSSPAKKEESGFAEWQAPETSQADEKTQSKKLEKILIPDWLTVDRPQESVGVIEDRLDWLGLEKAADTLPSLEEPDNEKAEDLGWLSVPSENTPQEEVPADAVGESVFPDWLNTTGGVEGLPAEELENAASKTTEAEIPSWFPEAGPGQEQLDQILQAESSETISDGAVESTELPEWLQAMRPIEAVPFTNEEAGELVHPETSGPLAGLKGVLPIREFGGQHGITSIGSAQLVVTEKQAAHIALLEEILKQESQPKPYFKGRTQAPQFLLRVIIGLLLLVILSIPIILDVQFFDLPQDYPAWVPPFYDAVKNIKEDSPVLVGFEYEPGYASEMKYVAIPVLQHLMEKNARLFILSTSFTGPVLGDALLKEAKTPLANDYSIEDKTINLGYLPGEATALKGLSLSFKGLTQFGSNTFYDGKEPWRQPQAAGIEAIKDFSMVIIITDNFDKARNWLEQVQVSLGGTPIYFISSAQISPLLRPYISSGQVGGLVSGIADGMAYRQLRNEPVAANGIWGAYQLGILFFIALIVIGVVFQTVLAPFSKKKTRKKGML